jgi:hypothetical protein
MRHSYSSGAGPRARWLLGLLALAWMACLNPRPEELPSDTPVADNLEGAGYGAGNGEASSPPPAEPQSPTPVLNPADGMTEGSAGSESGAGGSNENPADAGAGDEPPDGGGD